MLTCCFPRRAVAGSAAVAALALAACAPDPVAWDLVHERRVDPPQLAAGGSVAGADSTVERLVVPADGDTLALAGPPPDATGTRCPTSMRLTRVPGGRGVAAVWWAYRPDRSAALYASRTADRGATWSPPLPVDTVDRGEGGCDRPAPSLTVDSATGYLHVAYSMVAPEGPGVFYAHQMDPRGGFERPQVIVYGDRPAATSVASRGERVVVAYEDPNTGGRPFVSIALSRTAGHAWAERVPVTAGSVAAERPVVALRGPRQVVLGWVERTAPRELAGTDDPRAAVTPLPSGVVVRTGRLRE